MSRTTEDILESIATSLTSLAENSKESLELQRKSVEYSRQFLEVRRDELAYRIACDDLSDLREKWEGAIVQAARDLEAAERVSMSEEVRNAVRSVAELTEKLKAHARGDK